MVIDKIYNESDLLEIYKDKKCELVKGVIHEMSPSGKLHGFISANICSIVRDYVKKNKLGIVTGAETGYKLFSNPDTVKAPDMAFESNEKLAQSGIIQGYSTVMPDLVVEVNSPYDNYSEIIAKVNEWLSSGVKEVWVIEPKNNTVIIHTREKINILKNDDILQERDILPGFKCNVSEIFEIY
jgi:Uma2 family endonuclease